MFQSTPGRSTGRTRSSRLRRGSPRGFNPRPVARPGELKAWGAANVPGFVSIHARSLDRANLEAALVAGPYPSVSIHARSLDRANPVRGMNDYYSRISPICANPPINVCGTIRECFEVHLNPGKYGQEPCANQWMPRPRSTFAIQTTSGPSKSVARKRPYSLTRSATGSEI